MGRPTRTRKWENKSGSFHWRLTGGHHGEDDGNVNEEELEVSQVAEDLQSIEKVEEQQQQQRREEVTTSKPSTQSLVIQG